MLGKDWFSLLFWLLPLLLSWPLPFSSAKSSALTGWSEWLGPVGISRTREMGRMGLAVVAGSAGPREQSSWQALQGHQGSWVNSRMAAAFPAVSAVVLMTSTTAVALAMLPLDHEALCSQHKQTYDTRSLLVKWVVCAIESKECLLPVHHRFIQLYTQ